jgi:hypothetical protein
MALLFYWVRSAWRRHWEHYRYYLVYSRQTEYYSSRMPRAERTIAKGSPHHVTQRGNYRQGIFEVDEDFIQYQNCCAAAIPQALPVRQSLSCYLIKKY